uniref:Uncharacterized protein n=1 Tax=Anguilla anguilla TaxID=7936 RepID=A0A0E9VZN1_ANGAN
MLNMYGGYVAVNTFLLCVWRIFYYVHSIAFIDFSYTQIQHADNCDCTLHFFGFSG